MANLTHAFADEDLSALYPLHVEDMLVLKHLPRWSYAANENKKAFWSPQYEYIDAHYFSPQPYPSKRIAIVLDVDSDLDVAKMRELRMPMPRTITGRNRPGRKYTDDFSERPHLVYWLAQPVWMNRSKQANLYNDVAERLQRLLGVLCFVERINPTTTKNPAKCVYRTLDPLYHVIEGDRRTWGLEELSEAIKECEVAMNVAAAAEDSVYVAINQTVYSDTKTPAPKLQKAIGEQFRQHIANAGRHQELFENMRFLAYAFKADANSEDHLRNYMLDQCERYSATNFAHDPLPYSSLVNTAKSIARWTWRNYTGSGKDRDRGACYRAGLVNDTMSQRKKQKIGGQYAAQKNASKKQKIVFDAIAELRAAGKEVVISKLARELGMSRDTVRKYAAEAPDFVDDTAHTKTMPEDTSGVTKTVYIRDGKLNKEDAPNSQGGHTLGSTVPQNMWDAHKEDNPPATARNTTLKINDRGRYITRYLC